MCKKKGGGAVSIRAVGKQRWYCFRSKECQVGTYIFSGARNVRWESIRAVGKQRWYCFRSKQCQVGTRSASPDVLRQQHTTVGRNSILRSATTAYYRRRQQHSTLCDNSILRSAVYSVFYGLWRRKNPLVELFQQTLFVKTQHMMINPR